MLFMTLREEPFSSADVLELHRFRRQIELASKRLRQLLTLGHLPNKDPADAKSRILAKRVSALLVATTSRVRSTAPAVCVFPSLIVLERSSRPRS
jgi:hypothetical protein